MAALKFCLIQSLVLLPLANQICLDPVSPLQNSQALRNLKKANLALWKIAPVSLVSYHVPLPAKRASPCNTCLYLQPLSLTTPESTLDL
ncbi:hypothetical protein PCASD_07077 [Puccinia coronata f. sp. avenae]|uniref:Uncharacterized protein n=1 Tax=Puccinia coronata f. sp. avenae TaxID=200324 RepID=A0A2N5V6U0_9BASI|nr:hypothetical protein PCASD_07077 [Puccinia coronata f. sp. avenae]